MGDNIKKVANLFVISYFCKCKAALGNLKNARHEDVESGRFTQKFLIVAPGLIVYDRL
ncbi:hypothetical protein [Segatella copri]|uniref:hypothetical protein n=1 Tax=Segatella copri TaxID=165179 RepID=UPI00294B6296|nr:hypothetical protein [Segatella copri]